MSITIKHLIINTQNQNWIKSQTVDLGQTRKVCLRLTKQAKKLLNIDTDIPQHGSIVHEYWKRYYAQRFKEQGYKVELEVPRLSGRTDVVVSKDNRRIAVEIETGKSDFIRNIRQDLTAKYDKIIVVATNKTAFAKIEKALAIEGLLISGRVEIILQDELKSPTSENLEV